MIVGEHVGIDWMVAGQNSFIKIIIPSICYKEKR